MFLAPAHGPWLLAFGPWVLGANVRSKLLVALAFKVLFHFVQRGAKRRARGVERPCAFRASPIHPLHGFDHNHLRHSFPSDGIPSSCFRICAAWRSSTSAEAGAGDFSSNLAAAIACRRTVSTTSMGTCSKCVPPFRIAAAPVAECTVAVLESYGENLLYVFELT